MDADTELAIRTANAVNAMGRRLPEDPEANSDDQSSNGELSDDEIVDENADPIDGADDDETLPLGQSQLAKYRKRAGRIIVERRQSTRRSFHRGAALFARWTRVFEQENEIRAQALTENATN